MSTLISIVVPIYNTEAYLSRCIDSLLAQTHKNIEIILVDDGSPDRCGIICDKYADTDRRIKVLHQENKGVSEARNRGLMLASGDYVGFVDSDDFVATDMYEHMLYLAQKYDGDVIQCGRTNAYENNVLEISEAQKSVEVLNTEDALIELMCSRKVRTSACDKLYKRTIFENIRFDSSIGVGEDFVINYHLIERAKNIVISSHVGYFYFFRGDSTSKGMINPKHFYIFDVLENLCENEHREELIPYWKLRKAIYAMNFLRRMIPNGDFSEFCNFRKYMIDIKFILFNPRKYRVSKEKYFALHILLIWLMPYVYILLIKKNLKYGLIR